MIRIDLGKDEAERSTPAAVVEAPAAPKYVQDLLAKLKIRRPDSFDLLADATAVVVVGVSIALTVLVYLVFSWYRSEVISQHEKHMKKLDETATQIKAEIARFANFEKELQSYEQQKSLVRARIEGVRALLEGRNTPVNILDSVAQSLPARGWINSLILEARGETKSLKISGSALSNEEVSDFVDKLSESVYLSDVRLLGVTSSKSNLTETKTFDITAVPKGFLANRAVASPQKAGAAPNSAPPAAPRAAPAPPPTQPPDPTAGAG